MSSPYRLHVPVLLLAIGFLAAPRNGHPQGTDLYARAHSQLVTGDTIAALATLDDLTAAHPDFAAGWGLLGVVLTRRASTELTDFKERKAAEKALMRALELGPRNPLYLYTLGRLRIKQGIVEGAGRLRERAASDAERLIARAQRLLDEDPESLSDIERAEFYILFRMVLVDRARKWQALYERVRNEELPVLTHDYGCEEQLGRLCLVWLDERVDAHDDPDTLRVLRDTLLKVLRGTADSLPDPDAWADGFLALYLLEDGQAAEAMAVARDCSGSSAWWCSALVGHLHQVEGRFLAADSAFRHALADMPADQRRRWTDIGHFLDDSRGAAYRNLEPAARDSLERLFWWLADPLHVTPVNDRWTEHMSRRLLTWLYEDTPSGFGLVGGDDLVAVIVRHGWPAGWVKSPVRYNVRRGRQEYVVRSYYPANSRRFVPLPALLDDIYAIPPGAWPVNPRGSRATYAPPYAVFTSAEHQAATFQRGDSVEVLVAFDQTADSSWAAAPFDATLFFSKDERTPPAVATQRSEGGRGLFRLRLEPEPVVMSLELFAPHAGLAARARYGLRLRHPEPGVLALSSLLVTEPEPPPSTYSRAARYARGSLRVTAGERLGLYWELYGIGRYPEEMTVTLLAYRIDAEGRPETEGGAPISLRWKDLAPALTPVWPRWLRLELPADLEPGLYVIQLHVRSRVREPVTTARMILVEDPAAAAAARH